METSSFYLLTVCNTLSSSASHQVILPLVELPPNTQACTRLQYVDVDMGKAFIDTKQEWNVDFRFS